MVTGTIIVKEFITEIMGVFMSAAEASYITFSNKITLEGNITRLDNTAASEIQNPLQCN